MRRRLRRCLASAVIASCTLTACSSSGRSTSAPAQVINIGVLTDMTGPGASPSVIKGVEAGVGLAGTEGYHIHYIVGDTETSPSGALNSAQKMVEQDHVFAVILVSGLGFAAAPFFTSKNVPVVGVAEDSTEWITSRNMFSVIGTENYSKVITTYGKFFHGVGATRIGTLGLNVAPSAQETAKAAAISAQAEGVAAPYVNPNFPYGSTNVEPVAIAMKQAGVDGLTTAVTANINYLLIDALRQQGVDLKGALLPTGYGGDLESAGPAAQQAAQGVYFSAPAEPVEMHTAATKRLQSALATYAGVTGDPTYSEYWGYESVLAIVSGLQAAGAHTTQQSFMNALLSMRHVNPGGLYGNQSVSFAMDQRGQAAGVNNCFWITRYSGSTFQLVPGMEPLCGTILPGKTVSAS